MDFACEWAKGKKNVEDAAAEFVRKVNEAAGLTYDMDQGASRSAGKQINRRI